MALQCCDRTLYVLSPAPPEAGGAALAHSGVRPPDTGQVLTLNRQYRDEEVLCWLIALEESRKEPQDSTSAGLSANCKRIWKRSVRSRPVNRVGR